MERRRKTQQEEEEEEEKVEGREARKCFRKTLKSGINHFHFYVRFPPLVFLSTLVWIPAKNGWSS